MTVKRYRKYSDIPSDLLLSLAERVKESPYRQKFHIEPNMGSLGDPNGASYFGGKYHLFYQWSPLSASKGVWFHGWYHLTSKDLVTWEQEGPGLIADTEFETHGAYSGSGLGQGDKAILFYTGNTRLPKTNERVPYQIIASIDQTGSVTKKLPPVIKGFPEGYTDHFRDPKIWQQGSDFYAVIGAQRKNLTGAVLLLYMNEGDDWSIVGEVSTSYSNFGYMWECPNYLVFGEEAVLIFCPQGLEEKGNSYRNIHQCGYIVGDRLSKDNLNFNNQTTFTELDRGFDFYAAQVSQDNNRTILYAWMGLPDTHYPTEDNAYSGCLTFPRELTFQSGKLYQNPVVELQNYQREMPVPKWNKEVEYQIDSGFAARLNLNLINHSMAGKLVIDLVANEQRTAYSRLTIDYDNKTIILDRKRSGRSVSINYGFERQIYDDLSSEVFLDILIDRSSLEIFVNSGETAAASRIFPEDNQTKLFIDTRACPQMDDIKVTCYELDL